MNNLIKIWAISSCILFLFIVLISKCSSPLEPEVITIIKTDTLNAVLIDTLYEVSQESQISVSPAFNGSWKGDTLFVYFVGLGVNVSDEIIRSVSIELTITENIDRTSIVSNTIGYFLRERPPLKYVPNDPFPYGIQHDLSPGTAYNLYVGAKPLANISGAYGYFRIIVGGGLSKRIGDWQYGGEIGCIICSL